MYTMLRFVIMIFFSGLQKECPYFLRCNATFDVTSYKAISSKTDYCRHSTEKSQLSCTLPVSLQKFEIDIK